MYPMAVLISMKITKVTASSAGEVPAITALGKIVFNLSGDGWVKATASNNEDASKGSDRIR